jgi:hypothetical protein
MTSTVCNPRESVAELGFEIAGGSVAGADHLRVGRGSQDGFCWQRGRAGMVAVVTDGCGSSPHSGVGAILGGRLIVQALASGLERGLSPADIALWQGARAEVLANLRASAIAMGGDFAEVVADHFLFTIVGAVVTPELAAVFSIGDGVIAINGDVQVLGPYPGNQPPYLAYDLLTGAADAVVAELHSLRSSAEIESIFLASDGAADLRDVADETVPGRDEVVGPLSQFWTRDHFFRNRDAIRRRLAIIGRDLVSPDWERRRLCRARSLLRDDTTVIAIRRVCDRESQ